MPATDCIKVIQKSATAAWMHLGFAGSKGMQCIVGGTHINQAAPQSTAYVDANTNALYWRPDEDWEIGGRGREGSASGQMKCGVKCAPPRG